MCLSCVNFILFDVQTVKTVDYEYILVQGKAMSYESQGLAINIQWIQLNWRSMQERFGVFFAFWSQNVSVQTVQLIGLELAFGYLKVGDLEGAIFHQADSTIVPQDPLAVFLPLDTWGGVPHDVAV